MEKFTQALHKCLYLPVTHPHNTMVPLGPRLTTTTSKAGKTRYVTRPSFGIVQPEPYSYPGKVLMLIVDKEGNPWPMDNANPRWVPESLIKPTAKTVAHA